MEFLKDASRTLQDIFFTSVVFLHPYHIHVYDLVLTTSQKEYSKSII